MSAEVYFAQRRATGGGGLMDKIEQLLDAAGFTQVINLDDRVAIKTHFGEPGNTTHVRPEIVRRVVKKVRHVQGRPFVTDTNARDSEYRSEAITHLAVASAHGFTHESLGAPVIVADGLVGDDGVSTPTRGHEFDTVSVAAAIAAADSVIVINHVTLHPVVGMAGAVHHLGLGALTRSAKQQLSTAPARAALAAGASGKKAVVEELEPTSQQLQERIAEALSAVVDGKQGKVLYCNVLIDLTPDPDGAGWSDAAVVPDVGLMVSRDPVGLDQATADFLNMQTGIPGTRLSDTTAPDKIRSLVPEVDWTHLLKCAERLKLGSRDYELLII